MGRLIGTKKFRLDLDIWGKFYEDRCMDGRQANFESNRRQEEVCAYEERRIKNQIIEYSMS